MEPLYRTLAKGVIAGTAAVAALVVVRDALWALEGEERRAREAALRDGAEQTHLQQPVRDVAERAGLSLPKRTEERLGLALAWLMGVAGVVAYALARRREPRVGAAGGLAFGALVWLAEDEMLWPALGYAHGPQAYPWHAHARGLAAHLAYGVAAEGSLRALDQW